jgi:hypothetical protein
LSDNSDTASERKLLSSSCNIKGRIYVIDLLQFVNGCFASVSEDQNAKMGAITVSIKTGERATSSSLIPESKGSIFAKMIGELLADKLHGIAVVSLYLREELDADSMKTLINEIRKLLNKD